MNKNIKLIFRYNLMLFKHIEQVIFYFRTQNFDKALRLIAIMLDEFKQWIDVFIKEETYFCEGVFAVDINYISKILNDLLTIQENKDYVLLADIYEDQLLPTLINLQEIIMDKEGFVIDRDINYRNNIDLVKKNNFSIEDYRTIETMMNNLDEGYRIEYNSRGQYTLSFNYNSNQYYYHSNHCVVKESLQLINSWYSEEKSCYIIYGLGLGYHIDELLSLDNNIRIEVYECDRNIIQLACAFSELGSIFKKSNVTLNYDPKFTGLLERIKRISLEDEFVIHYPSMCCIKNIEEKEKLEDYFIQYSSIKNQLKLLNGNFRKNITHYDGLADELKNKFQGKDLYIIAAGPSLDNNFLYLKKVMDREEAIILATGTVLKKLVQAGIKPNYFIVIDANERVYSQISGLEHENIPMLYLSTSYHGFADNYTGEKYIILQKGYSKAEQYAKEVDSNLYRTGGSVSTTALDLGIEFNCKRIIFLGLDLAYSNHSTHAIGTSENELNSVDGLRQIEDINGNMIYTGKSLDIYRKWIESRISGVEEIEFLDATEGGAVIKGMKSVKLNKVI